MRYISSRLLIILSVGLVVGPSRSAVSAEPDPLFARANAVRVRSASLFRRPLLILDDGDYVFSRLSANGRFLAYADVVVKNNVESTALYVRDLKAGARRTLLDSDAASQYAAYKVFVTEASWLDEFRVCFTLSDGDVGSTSLTYDVRTGALVSSETSDEGDKLPEIPPRLRRLRSRILASFSAWSSEDLDMALRFEAIEVPGRGVILQKDDAGIWLLDLTRGREKRLLSTTKGPQHALGGGISVGGDTVFAVSYKSRAYLFALDGRNTLKPLAGFSKARWLADVRPRSLSSSGSFFLLRLEESSKKGHNPALYYSSKEGLLEISDGRTCYDFDVARKGDKAAFSFWVEGRRQLTVREKVTKSPGEGQ